jgi:hypothetical protein
MLAGYILGIHKSKIAIRVINREKKKNFIHSNKKAIGIIS